jgi:hypothetical protein
LGLSIEQHSNSDIQEGAPSDDKSIFTRSAFQKFTNKKYKELLKMNMVGTIY